MSGGVGSGLERSGATGAQGGKVGPVIWRLVMLGGTDWTGRFAEVDAVTIGPTTTGPAECAPFGSTGVPTGVQAAAKPNIPAATQSERFIVR